MNEEKTCRMCKFFKCTTGLPDNILDGVCLKHHPHTFDCPVGRDETCNDWAIREFFFDFTEEP
jgi:hypothetical protein